MRSLLCSRGRAVTSCPTQSFYANQILTFSLARRRKARCLSLTSSFQSPPPIDLVLANCYHSLYVHYEGIRATSCARKAFRSEHEVVRLVGDFLADSSTSIGDRNAVKRFLTAQPERSPVVNFVDDIDAHLELIRDIRKLPRYRISDCQSTTLAWSQLMVIPLDQLTLVRDRLLSSTEMGSVILRVRELPLLLKICMLLPLPRRCEMPL
jgi:hypothetical protein